MRVLEAKITLEYDGKETAEAVAKAVSPDNFKTPRGLSIKTTCEANEVLTQIRCKGKLPTFIATIDDLLFCTSTAEKALHAARKIK